MISQGQGNLLLVGTVRNCILQSTVDFNFSPVVQVGDGIYHFYPFSQCILTVNIHRLRHGNFLKVKP